VVQRPALGAAPGEVARLQQRLPDAGRATFRWLVEELLPGDRVAVLAWNGELVLLQDFSRDRRAAGEALERAASGRVEAGRWPSRYASEEQPSTLADALGSGLAAPADATLVDVLPLLAGALRGVAGRKNLLLLGDDLPRPGGPDDDGAFARAEQALNEANVAVYAVGLIGRGRQEGADRLARVTGGESFYRAASVLDPLRAVARQTSGYYLLGVALPAEDAAGGYHPLLVRTRDPQLRVRARTGFAAGGGEG
ncbi:MAG: VWA domain-containing protein, partial [Acidobacteria bacterium]|nr:VWA domain-containing protein [Acidobacteriota bacterium]